MGTIRWPSLSSVSHSLPLSSPNNKQLLSVFPLEYVLYYFFGSVEFNFVSARTVPKLIPLPLSYLVSWLSGYLQGTTDNILF